MIENWVEQPGKDHDEVASKNRITAEEAARLLQCWSGGVDAELLGQGMEGLVFHLDDDRVAKVWFSANETNLRRTSRFYDALATRPFSFSAPRIHEVAEVGGCLVTIEQRLAGTTLKQRQSDDLASHEETREVFVDVLAELNTSGPVPEGRTLSVMDEQQSLYDGASDFAGALGGLVQRRAQKFADVLEPAVDRLDKVLDAVGRRLSEVDTGRRSVIHGDLILANILVDEDGRPSAVLDWGFLTTEGDPAFDAAVAASIFDMYGEAALETELGLYDEVEARLGFERETLLVYRAAYSLATANAYDPEGKDGHFAWCVAALNRQDVRQALLG